MLALREWLHPSKWEIIGNVEPWGRRVIYQVWRRQQLVVAVHGKTTTTTEKKDRCFFELTVVVVSSSIVLVAVGKMKENMKSGERRGAVPCDDVV